MLFSHAVESSREQFDLSKTCIFCLRWLPAFEHSTEHRSSQMPPKKEEDEPVVLLGRFGTSLKIGIVGLPNVGFASKLSLRTISPLFNASNPTASPRFSMCSQRAPCPRRTSRFAPRVCALSHLFSVLKLTILWQIPMRAALLCPILATIGFASTGSHSSRLLLPDPPFWLMISS